MLKFNITSLAKWSTNLSSIRSITSSPYTIAIALRNITVIKKNSTHSILSQLRLSSPSLRITQTSINSRYNSNARYYYTANSTLTTSNGKGQQDEKDEEKILFTTKSENNSQVEDGLIIRFREAIQEEDLEKLITIHYTLKEQG